MEPWQLAIALKPLGMVAFTTCVLYPVRRLTQRYFPEGRVKRVLLWQTNRPVSRRVFWLIWGPVLLLIIYGCWPEVSHWLFAK